MLYPVMPEKYEILTFRFIFFPIKEIHQAYFVNV